MVVVTSTPEPLTLTPTPTPPPPTPTNTPTNTPTPTPTPTPKPVAVVQAEALNVRGGPGTEYDVVGQVKQGDELEIVARTEEGDWLQVLLTDGEEGWVSAQLVEVSGRVTGIPVAVVILPPSVPMPIVLYRDYFSDPESGWFKGPYESSEFRYEQGEYVILVREGSWVVLCPGPEDTFTDFTLEADVRQVEGPESASFGLIFRHVDSDNFYDFRISGYGTYNLFKQANDELQDIDGMKWTSSSHIKMRGVTNHLKVVCAGPQIALYINGHHLSTVSDDSFAEGKIGLIVGAVQGSDPIKVAFDNFVVSGTEAGLPKPTATPTACSFKPSGIFRGVWQAERGRLGCALNEVKVFTAEQPFENGFMFWREDTRQIYVLHSEGTWEVFHDTWTEDQPKYSCPDVAPSQSPPTPLRGFGKVWCEQLGGPSAAIGWATDRELGLPDDRWVVCERGMMLWSDQWGIFVLYRDGTWYLRG